MKYRAALLAMCLISMLMLVGCQYDETNFNTDGGTVSGDGSGTSGNGTTDGSGNGINTGHSPEPATLGLIGTGLFAYALLRRRKRR